MELSRWSQLFVKRCILDVWQGFEQASVITLILFLNGGPYHIETSPLICWANQYTGFYMLEISVKKKLI